MVSRVTNRPGCSRDSAVASTIRVFPDPGSEEKNASYRTSGGNQSSQVHLVNIDNLLDCLVLTDDKRTEIPFE
jgi:hypothetical protein